MIIDTPAVNNVCNHLLSIRLTYASFHKAEAYKVHIQ